MGTKTTPKQSDFIFDNLTFEMLARHIQHYEEQARSFEQENKIRVPYPIPCIDLRGRLLYTDISLGFDGENFIVFYRESYKGKAITWKKLSAVKILLRIHVAIYLQDYIPSNQVFTEKLGIYKQELMKSRDTTAETPENV